MGVSEAIKFSVGLIMVNALGAMQYIFILKGSLKGILQILFSSNIVMFVLSIVFYQFSFILLFVIIALNSCYISIYKKKFM